MFTSGAHQMSTRGTKSCHQNRRNLQTGLARIGAWASKVLYLFVSFVQFLVVSRGLTVSIPQVWRAWSFDAIDNKRHTQKCCFCVCLLCVSLLFISIWFSALELSLFATYCAVTPACFVCGILWQKLARTVTFLITLFCYHLHYWAFSCCWTKQTLGKRKEMSNLRKWELGKNCQILGV